MTPRARMFTFGALGVGAAALAVGAGFGWGAAAAVSERRAATTEAGFYSADQTGRSRATVANAAFAASGVALVGSVVLWLEGDAWFGLGTTASAAAR